MHAGHGGDSLYNIIKNNGYNPFDLTKNRYKLEKPKPAPRFEEKIQPKQYQIISDQLLNQIRQDTQQHHYEIRKLLKFRNFSDEEINIITNSHLVKENNKNYVKIYLINFLFYVIILNIVKFKEFL